MDSGTSTPVRPVALRGRRMPWLWGPAFVAAIAYVDPGNVAANLTAGAQFGYTLVWVIVTANLMAVLVQYLSAKLGLVTQRSLAEQVGDAAGGLRAQVEQGLDGAGGLLTGA